MNLIQRIDALLPQTQCGKCGHPGCKPYAEGIAQGEAINKCPPGGQETIVGLARLLNVPVLQVDTSRGEAPAQIAYIREAECIGCTKCIQACPVDAIVGAAKLMHTVIADECTGCDLCVAPLPGRLYRDASIAHCAADCGGAWPPTNVNAMHATSSVTARGAATSNAMHACNGRKNTSSPNAWHGPSARHRYKRHKPIPTRRLGMRRSRKPRSALQ